MKKRILITGVGMHDPYNTNNLTEGAIAQIIRKYNTKEIPITDVYIYFTNDIAISEYRSHAIETAIKFADEKIKIHIFPKNIIKDIEKKQEEIMLDLIDKDTVEENLEEMTIDQLRNIKSVGRVDVNKFGTFYGAIAEMVNAIKCNVKKVGEKIGDYEILVNVSSGTPAMKADLNLFAVVNDDLKISFLQVNSSKSSTGYGKKPTFYDYTKKDVLRDLEKVDLNERQSFEQRVHKEDMVNIKKMLLLDSVNDLFCKKDYSGVYHALLTATENDVLENKSILYYAENLYFRYIGDEENAKKAEEKLKKLGETIELYPPLHMQTEVKDSVNSNWQLLFENYNILKTKEERNEINDWLLIGQPIIENIYKKLLYKICGIDIGKITTEDDRLDYDKWEKQPYSTEIKSLFDTYMYKNSKKNNFGGPNHINAYMLIEMLNKVYAKFKVDKKIKETIQVLDKLREFRNECAHKLEFVTKKKLQEGFTEKIEKININLRYPNDVIKETYYLLDELISYICDKKVDDIYEYKKVYGLIEQEIVELLNQEIYGERKHVKTK